MKTIFVIELVLVAALAVFLRLLLVPKFKGWFGEWLMSVLLRKLDRQRCCSFESHF